MPVIPATFVERLRQDFKFQASLGKLARAYSKKQKQKEKKKEKRGKKGLGAHKKKRKGWGCGSEMERLF